MMDERLEKIKKLIADFTSKGRELSRNVDSLLGGVDSFKETHSFNNNARNENIEYMKRFYEKYTLVDPKEIISNINVYGKPSYQDYYNEQTRDFDDSLFDKRIDELHKCFYDRNTQLLESILRSWYNEYYEVMGDLYNSFNSLSNEKVIKKYNSLFDIHYWLTYFQKYYSKIFNSIHTEISESSSDKINAYTTQQQKAVEKLKKEHEEYRKKTIKEINDLVKEYNESLIDYNLTKNAIKRKETFDANYDLPLYPVDNGFIKYTNSLLVDEIGTEETIINNDNVSFNSENAPYPVFVESHNDLDRVMKFYEETIYRFLLSYPGMYKKVVAIHNNPASPFSLFMADIKSIENKGKGYLYPSNPVPFYSEANEISEIINELNSRIKTISNKLGGRYKDVYEFNHSNPDNAIDLVLFVYHGLFEGEVDISNKNKVLSILMDGPRCGIIPIVCYGNETSQNHLQNHVDEFKKAINDRVLSKEKHIDVDLFSDSCLWHLEDNFKYELLEFLKSDLSINDKAITLQSIWEKITPENIEKKRSNFSSKLVIPIGKTEAGALQELELSVNDSSAHCIVVGKTGTGKTKFISSLILNACYIYSPDELEIDLIDFKDGQGFDIFAKNNFKHLKFVSLKNKINDAIDIVDYVNNMIEERIELIKSAGNIDTIYKYNELVEPSKRIPRTILVIDEYQKILDVESIVKKLENIAKTGRSAGISLILSSQDIPSTGKFKPILDQITNRFIFECNNDDILRMLVKDSPRRNIDLTNAPVGTAIYSQGEAYKTTFRSVFAGDDNEMAKNVSFVSSRYPDYKNRIIKTDEPKPLLIDNEKKVENSRSIGAMKHEYTINGRINYSVGKYNISDHVASIFQNEDNPVLLVLGDYVRSKNIIASSIISSLRTFSIADVEKESKYFVVDMCPNGREKRADNPIDALFKKQGELIGSGKLKTKQLFYYDSSNYLEESDDGEPSFIETLENIVDERENNDIRNPIIVSFLYADYITKEVSSLASLVKKCTPLDIYFIFHFKSLDNDFYKSTFRMSTNNVSLIKDAIILSDVETTYDDDGNKVNKEIESLTALSSLENLNLIDRQQRDFYANSLKESNLSSCHGIIIDDRNIKGKFRFYQYTKDVVGSLDKVFLGD